MLGPLRRRDFALLWSGLLVSMVGDGIYLVAIAWQVYDLTNSPSSLAFVGLAWTLPMVIALPFSGVISDRFDRRRLLIAGDLIRGAAVGTMGALALAHEVQLWHLVILAGFYGVGEAIFQPPLTAIVPTIVPGPELVPANALKELLEPLGLQLAGPALGGVLVGAFDAGTAFAVDAATFALCAGALFAMRSPPIPELEERTTVRGDVAKALRYIRSQPWLWATLCAAALALLAAEGPIEVLVPYIIRNDLGGDAGTFGWVLAAGGVGAILSALLLGRRGLPRRFVTFMYLTWFVGIGLYIGIAIAGSAWQMAAFAFLAFAGFTAGMIVWNTMMQRLVPSNMLGRVSSLDWFVSIGLIPVSYAITGPIAAAVGARTTLAAAGVLGLATALFLFIPGVRNPERA
jgi:predicted MFS family arabinose efflux permease